MIWVIWHNLGLRKIPLGTSYYMIYQIIGLMQLSHVGIPTYQFFHKFIQIGKHDPRNILFLIINGGFLYQCYYLSFLTYEIDVKIHFNNMT
jgi:hypothetical protein